MVEISCVVSGSFTKAKKEIDEAIRTFKEGGVKVLSPEEGELYFPSLDTFWSQGSYPLASERKLSEVQAKTVHLEGIVRAHFVYFVAPGGYLGGSASFEAGFAYALDKPVYSSEPIDPELEGGWWSEDSKVFQVKSPKEVLDLWLTQKFIQWFWFPRRYVLVSPDLI